MYTHAERRYYNYVTIVTVLKWVRHMCTYSLTCVCVLASQLTYNVVINVIVHVNLLRYTIKIERKLELASYGILSNSWAADDE